MPATPEDAAARASSALRSREAIVTRQYLGGVAVAFAEPIAAERFSLDFEL
jgi:hypothetical protein